MTALAFDPIYEQPAATSSPALALVPAPTLDEALTGAWSALTDGFSTCPVCHEETMTARWSAGHGLAGGRCASCSATLE